MASQFLKTTISQRAREYVLSLSRDQVTSRQKHLLMAIAENYSDRYDMAIMDLDSLCEYVLVGRRQIRRILQDLGDFVEYIPGRGSGNFGRFKLHALAAKGDIKGVQRGHKEDISNTPNKEEDLNPNLRQEQKPMAFDSELRHSGKNFPLVSSSESTNHNDDTKVNLSPALHQVVEAFRGCPATTGKVRQSDLATAAKLLERFTAKQICDGIAVGGARRVSSIPPNICPESQVQSLAYFLNAIEEVASSPELFSTTYIQYVHSVMRRWKSDPDRYREYAVEALAGTVLNGDELDKRLKELAERSRYKIPPQRAAG